MKNGNSWGRFWLILAVVLPLIASCGPTPTATPPLPTQTVEVQPTDTIAPTPTPAPTNTPEPTPATAARFEKASCPFDLPAGVVEGETIECGYLLVPEDRAQAASRTIRLAVAIIHPQGGASEPDPILFLTGGPGGSTLEGLSLTFSKLEPLLKARRDLILFDQRGVGRSEPALDCPKLNELNLELLDYELDGKQYTDAEIAELNRQTLLDCAASLSQIADLSAYNSAASAADVNDLRQALGYDQVNLWGVSYGTRLALEVMRDYPQGIRSVVLDSVYPPDINLYVAAPANADRAFDLFFAGCAADQACNAAYPDLRTLFFDTVDRLNATPASLTITDATTGKSYDAVMNGDSLVGLLFQLLYETDIIPALPKLISDASQGQYSMIELILSSLLAQQEFVSIGMQFSVQCNEELSFSSLADLEEAIAQHPELAQFFEYSVVGKFAFQVCEGWNSGRADPIANEAVSSDLPTLIITGEYDPITPPDFGRHVAQTLPNSFFFEYPGMGHGVSLIAGCPTDMMIAFFQDPTTAPDSTCIEEMGGPQWVVPAEGAETIVMEPFTNKQMGIQGVVPAGWTEVNAGVYARRSSALDAAVVIAQGAPMSAPDLLGLLVRQLGLKEPPASVGEREANGLTWNLYAVTVQGLSVDFALAESEGLGLIVLLQSAPEEHDFLYQAVFLPVIDALTPLAESE